jgi:DNA-directed RNA polymerase subunit RPC12/RpoP
MAALTERKAARARITAVFHAALDRVLPADESVPLRGGTFLEWEQQADELERIVLPTFLEERAALADQARVEEGGRCPHCGSERVYLEKQRVRPVERQTPHGVVVLAEQTCRCRSCDRTFSPSGPGVGLAAGGRSVAGGGAADGAGRGDADLSPGGGGVE